MSEELNKSKKIYVAGHRGMVGSAIVRQLKKNGHENIVFKTSAELDLTQQSKVEDFFKTEKPAYVVLAAAKVGVFLPTPNSPQNFCIRI
jgi:GDP-L-fucose synthase